MSRLFGTDGIRGVANADLTPELAFAVGRAGAAVLGLGHGARALALAFGGRLRPADRPIRGWVMVETSIPHLIAAGPWLTWQHDVIALPGDAQVLARNRLGVPGSPAADV